MREPGCGVATVDEVHRPADRFVERVACPGTELAEQRLQLAPAQFDGVQVRRVRGQVQHTSPGGVDETSDLLRPVRANVVEHDDVAGCSFRRRTRSRKVSKTSASVAPSTVIIARTPFMSSAPIIVVTVPALRGTVPCTRPPRGERAYSRVMAMLLPASSMKTSRRGSRLFASSMNLRRRAWMRGSPCSTAVRLFFFASARASAALGSSTTGSRCGPSGGGTPTRPPGP